MSVEESHKGKSVTIQLRQGILGCLAPPATAWRMAMPPLRHKQVGVLDQGEPRELWLNSAGTGTPKHVSNMRS